LAAECCRYDGGIGSINALLFVFTTSGFWCRICQWKRGSLYYMKITTELLDILQQALRQAFPGLYADEASATGAVADFDVTISLPSMPEYGDLCTPVCLKLAKPLRRSPMQICEELATVLRQKLPSYVREITVGSPGYINFLLTMPSWPSK